MKTSVDITKLGPKELADKYAQSKNKDELNESLQSLSSEQQERNR